MSKKREPQPFEHKVIPVRVDWVDSTKSSGWREYEKTDLRCSSVGILVESDPDRVVIALSLSHADSTIRYANFLEIPIEAVKKVTKL